MSGPEIAEMKPSMNLSSEAKGDLQIADIASAKLNLSRPHFEASLALKAFANPLEPLPPSKPSSYDRTLGAFRCSNGSEEGVSLRGTCCGEGVIRHSIPGWSDDGASHRMNCDTPPLKGYCQGTLVTRCERYQTSDLNEIRVPY